MQTAANPAKPRSPKAKKKSAKKVESTQRDARLEVLSTVRQNFSGGSFMQRVLVNGGLVVAAALVARDVQAADRAEANYLLAGAGAELAATLGMRRTSYALVKVADQYARRDEC